jgi:hypothetical protein
MTAEPTTTATWTTEAGGGGRATVRPRRSRILSLVAVAVVLTSCGTDAGAPAGNGGGGSGGGGEPRASIPIPPLDGPYDWTIDPKSFVSTIDNPYFPLEPGTTLVYEGRSDGERQVVTIEVTRKTKEILGVTCVVVKDTVEVDGEVAEFTYDWYAQDVDGNVWYMGEDTKEYENGKISSTEGSWEAGVDGALPGVIMAADPTVGLAYTQEHYAGEAEDKARVIRVGDSVTVPFGSFHDVLVTEEWTPLEPRFLENKYYAPGVGVVFEELVKGGHEVNRLVEVHGPA